MAEFDGQTALITGGAGGLGIACAQRFLSEGASVVLADHTVEAAQKAADLLAAPGRVQAIAVDVTDADAVEAAVKKAAQFFNGLDILVNSAGVHSVRMVSELSPTEWRHVHAVNLDGTFFTSQSFVAYLVANAKKGVVVNLSSMGGMTGQSGRPAYVSTKHAVIGVTRTMAMEFGLKGIRINAVAPGIIRTAMSEKHYGDPEKVRRMNAAHPLGRTGLPHEVASAVRFLCSSDASFITGAIIAVDGGYTAGKDWQ